jgi:hypothetical protein
VKEKCNYGEKVNLEAKMAGKNFTSIISRKKF